MLCYQSVLWSMWMLICPEVDWMCFVPTWREHAVCIVIVLPPHNIESLRRGDVDSCVHTHCTTIWHRDVFPFCQRLSLPRRLMATLANCCLRKRFYVNSCECRHTPLNAFSVWSLTVWLRSNGEKPKKVFNYLSLPSFTFINNMRARIVNQ